MSSPLVAARPGASQIKPASDPAATRVADGVWVSNGLSNSYMVTTGDGRVILNCGMGFEAPVHKANFDAVDDSPVRYIVFTQGHVDHVGGADYLATDSTEMIAQSNNAACQADDARIHAFRVRRSLPYWAEAIAAAHDYIVNRTPGSEIPAQSQPTPTITFDDSFTFECGAVSFELYSTPGGETIDSLVAWLPETRVALVGNLFSALFGHVPNFSTVRGDRYRFVPDFIDSLERVRSLEPEVLLTGHFGPIRGKDTIDTELVRIRDGVAFIHDATVDGMNSGTDQQTLMREIRLPEHLSLGEGYGCVPWAIKAIWEGYAGWFQGEATTDLFNSPVADVYTDIVDLAGSPDAVLERAALRLTDGDPLACQQLCEILLGADPAHRGALDLSLQAHKALAATETGNFWKAGWLQTRIRELQETLTDTAKNRDDKDPRQR